MIRFSGYAAIFDRPDRGGDIIRPHACAAASAPLPLLWEHGAPAGTVEWLGEDSEGLAVVCRTDRPVRPGMGLSIGYRVRAARQSAAARELIDLALMEVSLVHLPMQAWARVIAVE